MSKYSFCRDCVATTCDYCEKRQIRADAIEKCKDVIKTDYTKECTKVYECVECLCGQFERLKNVE